MSAEQPKKKASKPARKPAAKPKPAATKPKPAAKTTKPPTQPARAKQRARPPTAPKAATVDRDLLPRLEEAPEPPPSTDLPGRPSLTLHRLSWIPIGFGVACLLAFIAINASGGGGHKAPVVVPVTTSQTESTQTTTTTEKAPPVRKVPLEVIWAHPISTDINTSFGLDHFPIVNEPTGFEVTDVEASNEALEGVGGTKVAAWHGHGQPYFGGCQQTLGSSASGENVELLSAGQWICAQTDAGNIARIHYEGHSGTIYSFYVTAYRPPH